MLAEVCASGYIYLHVANAVFQENSRGPACPLSLKDTVLQLQQRVVCQGATAAVATACFASLHRQARATCCITEAIANEAAALDLRKEQSKVVRVVRVLLTRASPH